jgi:17beta-estradiol 17-dehydrogenase / very-long-chain 3-oxoacyl-CoA reductase
MFLSSSCSLHQSLIAINKSAETMYVVSDASTAAVGATVASVAEAVNKLPVTILVNNVGVASERLGSVDALSDKEIDDMILVNCLYSTKLTKYMIPILARQERSLIINVSSISATVPAPYLSVYAGTKVYNRHFSNSIRLECASRGIDVVAITPAYVMSNMTKIKKTSMAVCSPRRCARDSLDRVGLTECSPYWHHAVSQAASSLIPNWYLNGMMLKTMKKTMERQVRNMKVDQKKE